MFLKKIHHIAIIASDYRKSLSFYCNILGFKLINEQYRKSRDSWKAELSLGDDYLIELFSFPDAPPRITYPEACGLRHLAFTVDKLEVMMNHLAQHGIQCEPIRYDEMTGQRFTFFTDPDHLPLELYEVALNDASCLV